MADDPAEVGYHETADLVWTERAFTLLEQQRLTATPRYAEGVVSVVVEGPCPRCWHQLVERWVDTVVVGTGAGARGVLRDDGALPDYLEVDVTCRCGVRHADAPDDTAGCGASFRIALQADDSDESAPAS